RRPLPTLLPWPQARETPTSALRQRAAPLDRAATTPHLHSLGANDRRQVPAARIQRPGSRGRPDASLHRADVLRHAKSLNSTHNQPALAAGSQHADTLAAADIASSDIAAFAVGSFSTQW